MQLSISGERSIREIQNDFSNAYPFLKIEFFKNGLKRLNQYPAHLKIENQRKLKDSWHWKKDSGQLSLSDAMTVLALESAFIDEFGLSVQVFRKSGNIWLETIMTDHWTLKQQNDHGREISCGRKEMYRPYDQDRDLDRDNN